jgi:tripartite-type tricarboxylate transporter receptor subunit TctC
MQIQRHRFLRLAAGVAVAFYSIFLSSHVAWCQTARTIKIIVPYPPGGPNDFLARILAEQIGRTQGLTMVIETRPGGGTVIGTEAVSRAAPDGNTLLIVSSDLVISPHLRRLNYDPMTSFEPICYLVTSPIVLTVNSAAPYRTLANLLDAARAKPGDLTLATTPTSAFRIAFEMLKRAAAVDITFVPYSGGGPGVTALLGGHVTSILSSYQAVAEQVTAGKLRVLATAARTRAEALPEVPTVAEFGYKDYEADVWYGLVAPAKMPKETASQLAGWFTAALHVPEVKAKLAIQGLYPVGMCGADFGAYLHKQYDEYGRVIREANIKAE